MTSYETIYNKFLSKIEDRDFALMEEEDQSEMLLNWLDTALSIMAFDCVETSVDLEDKDDDAETFNNDLKNYEIEGLSLYMVVAWYEPKVNSLEHTLAFFGSKDEKYTNQKDHLKATREVQDSYRKRARMYFDRYGTSNNIYLNGDDDNA